MEVKTVKPRAPVAGEDEVDEVTGARFASGMVASLSSRSCLRVNASYRVSLSAFLLFLREGVNNWVSL